MDTVTKASAVLDLLNATLGDGLYSMRVYQDSHERRVMLVDANPSTDMEALAGNIQDILSGATIQVISRWPFVAGRRIVITWER